MYGPSHCVSRPTFPQDALEVIGCENFTMKRNIVLTEACSSQMPMNLCERGSMSFSCCDKMQKIKTTTFALVCNISITSYSIMQLSYNSGIDP